MLPFPSIKSRHTENRRNNGGWLNLNTVSDEAEKIQSRVCRPGYFHKLLKKLSPPEAAGEQRRQKTQQLPIVPPKTVKTTQISKVSMDKPLPPTPGARARARAKAEEEDLKITYTQSRRIIAPLALTDLQKLFSGAPQFLACSASEEKHLRPPLPHVKFPWDEEARPNHLRDHMMIENPAWAYISVLSLGHTSSEKVQEDSLDGIRSIEPRKPALLPKFRERPNMLSMQGLEKGTIGYVAALELAVADEGSSNDEFSIQSISFHRMNFFKSNEGLRPLTDSVLIEKLNSLDEMYYQGSFTVMESSVYLYTDLFTQVLFPPSKIIDTDDPHSLEVQIYCLFEALSAPNVWIDFSKAEWRIGLGHILWGSPKSQIFQGKNTLEEKEEVNIPGAQRYWLLLQILLGCEILLRLDILKDKIEREEAPQRINHFGQQPTPSAMWTLLLAHIWLENIRVERPQLKKNTKTTSSTTRASTSHRRGSSATEDLISDLKFYGKNQARQVSALIDFAKTINWPNIEKFAEELLGRDLNSTSETISTDISHSQNTRQNILQTIHPGGSWQANSYINGLILPGESLRWLILSTLLVNDKSALSSLGDQVNLHGGFIYEGMSFWSSTCIIGKVLAAGTGASECMGWISSDVLPSGGIEGWISVGTKLTYEDRHKKNPKSRIFNKTKIEKQSDIIAGTDTSSTLPGDFILPSERPALPIPRIKFLALELAPSTTKTPAETDSDAEDSKISKYSSSIRFWVHSQGESEKEIRIRLAYNVHFVTAYPCTPPSSVEVLHSPTNPSFRKTKSELEPQKTPTGHPLYKAFTYTKIKLSLLLSMPIETRLTTFLTLMPPDPTQSSVHTTSSSIPKVLVIDCSEDIRESNFKKVRNKYGSDVEILARSLCAERGWNALISRQYRSCLACSIREASALGWRVIIRLT